MSSSKQKNCDKFYQQFMEHHQQRHAPVKNHNQSKPWKLSHFKQSISKLLRLKSQSAKCLVQSKPVNDPTIDIIPSTRYLSPKIINKYTPNIAQNTLDGYTINMTNQSRHSCSDLICKRSSTFCVTDNLYSDAQEIDKLKFIDNSFRINSSYDTNCPSVQNVEHIPSKKPIVSSNSAFIHYQDNLEHIDINTAQNPSFTTTQVSHSISMPLHLSRSVQNVILPKQEIPQQPICKRLSRRRGILNCSLFKKRTKSSDKANASTKSKSSEHLNNFNSKTKSLTRNFKQELNALQNDASQTTTNNLQDRSVTLPNLKDAPDEQLNNSPQELFSFDLVKDYLNKSEHTLSTHTSTYNQQHSYTDVRCASNNNSSCGQSLRSNTPTQTNKCMIQQNPSIPQQKINSSTGALNLFNKDYQNEKRLSKAPPLLMRQTSEPVPQTPPRLAVHHHGNLNQSLTQHQYSNQPPSQVICSAPIEFWTRPMHEKLKASRRRLQDNQYGCQEALMRSLSPAVHPDDLYITHTQPQQPQIPQPHFQHVIYHNMHREMQQMVHMQQQSQRKTPTNQLQAIIEPENTESNDNKIYLNHESFKMMNRSMSVYSQINTGPPLTNPNNHHKNNLDAEILSSTTAVTKQHSQTSPMLENRLTQSPMVTHGNIQHQSQQHHRFHDNSFSSSNNSNNYLIKDEDQNISQIEKHEQFKSMDEINEPGPNTTRICNKDNKSVKSINSSTDMILTRTPTPPQLFAEEFSSVSSIPVPKEFDNYGNKPVNGNVNLVYKSDDECDNDDDDDGVMDYEPVSNLSQCQAPKPPPRTDSVIRSYQLTQEEQEEFYDEEKDEGVEDNDRTCKNLSQDQDKSELEYDISSEEALPDLLIKDNSNTPTNDSHKIGCITSSDTTSTGELSKKCDMKKYSQWLEKLPYKLSEFPDFIHGKLSMDSTTADQLKSDLQDGSILDAEELRNLASIAPIHRKSWNSPVPPTDQEPEAIVAPSHQSVSPAMTESTLLKQYSHLYSLKLPLPSSALQHQYTSSSLESLNCPTGQSRINMRHKFSHHHQNRQQLFNLHYTKRKSVPDTKTPVDQILNNTCPDNVVGNNDNNIATTNPSQLKFYSLL